MDYTFSAPKRPVNRVFIHCSDSDNPAHDDVRVIREWHTRDNGWSDVGYHLFITKAGTVQTGRSLEKVPAAQAGHNEGSIAVCLSGRDRFTEAQFAALRALCEQIHGQLPLSTFHGHREVTPYKTCPNFDYRAVVGLNARGELV